MVDEELINNMSFVFFEDVLDELGHKLTYEAVSNYAGNSFCEKSWEMIQDNNPFVLADDSAKGSSRTASALANFFSSANIEIIKPEGKSYSERLKEQRYGKDHTDAGNAGQRQELRGTGDSDA